MAGPRCWLGWRSELSPAPARIAPAAITAWECVTAAGDGRAALIAALTDNRSRLGPLGLFDLPFAACVGEVRSPLPAVRPALQAYACRNARLGLHALNQGGLRGAVATALARYGAGRIGVVLGTSTSGIYDSETAYAQFLEQGRMPDDLHFTQRHTAQATAEFLRDELALAGPCYVLSTACSSSAKALGSAQRLLATGLCDAVLAGGVDSLCRLTLRGFHSLELISPEPAAPMDRRRGGISIGEAAALLMLERSAPEHARCPALLAVGESSDAHHMSAPHPEGHGAIAAMRAALNLAGLAPDAVGYVNLHATATPQNDLMEARALAAVFPAGVPCSGVKGLLGHTLGAAGAVEALVCLAALEYGVWPGTAGLREPDPDSPAQLLREPRVGAPPRYALSNSFGFGGSNASVLLAGGSVA